MTDNNTLLSMAQKAMKSAYAPYSQFRVGAALLCRDGTIFCGCNIENASYSATMCAERAALFAAVSAGHTDFEALAVVGGKQGEVQDYCFPCGSCLQVLHEFCTQDFTILSRNALNEIKTVKLGNLLPLGFTLEG